MFGTCNRYLIDTGAQCTERATHTHIPDTLVSLNLQRNRAEARVPQARGPTLAWAVDQKAALQGELAFGRSSLDDELRMKGTSRNPAAK